VGNAAIRLRDQQLRGWAQEEGQHLTGHRRRPPVEPRAASRSIPVPSSKSPCPQPPSALQQPFPGISSSGFGLSPVLGELWPLRFTTKPRFGFPPPCCSITQELRQLQPSHSHVLGKGETAPACKASQGIFWCRRAVSLIEQERDKPKGRAQRKQGAGKHAGHAQPLPSAWGSQ